MFWLYSTFSLKCYPNRIKIGVILKRNENNEMVRYKTRLVAQGFLERLGIDFDQAYSSIIDDIMFCYLIFLVVTMSLDIQLMDIMTAYLYGSLDANIYMKILYGFKILEIRKNENCNLYSIKLQRSLFGLK